MLQNIFFAETRLEQPNLGIWQFYRCLLIDLPSLKYKQISLTVRCCFQKPRFTDRSVREVLPPVSGQQARSVSGNESRAHDYWLSHRQNAASKEMLQAMTPINGMKMFQRHRTVPRVKKTSTSKIPCFDAILNSWFHPRLVCSQTFTRRKTDLMMRFTTCLVGHSYTTSWLRYRWWIYAWLPERYGYSQQASSIPYRVQVNSSSRQVNGWTIWGRVKLH